MTEVSSAEQLAKIRERWQVVSRQIEAILTGGDFTGRIEVNCMHSWVKNYQPTPTILPEDEERRQAERRSTKRDGDDRRMA